MKKYVLTRVNEKQEGTLYWYSTKYVLKNKKLKITKTLILECDRLGIFSKIKLTSKKKISNKKLLKLEEILENVKNDGSLDIETTKYDELWKYQCYEDRIKVADVPNCKIDANAVLKILGDIEMKVNDIR